MVIDLIDRVVQTSFDIIRGEYGNIFNRPNNIDLL